MSGEEEIAALVVDNGSGMCKVCVPREKIGVLCLGIAKNSRASLVGGKQKKRFFLGF